MKSIALLVLPLAVCCYGEEMRLAADPAKWKLNVFETGAVPERDAGQCGTLDGEVVFAGPWLAGSHGLRCEYADSLPVREGRITGTYRTEGLQPFEAVVTLGFYRGSTRLAQRSTGIGPAADWTPLNVPVRRLPEGTNRIVVGVGLGEKSRGRAYFSNLRATDEPLKVEFPADAGEIKRAAPPASVSEPGFVRIRQVEGTWWFVGPDGKAFYSLGTDAVAPAGLEGGLAVAGKMSALGFNSLGGWHSAPRWAAINDSLVAQGKEPMIAFRAFETGTMKATFDRLTNARGDTPGTHTFPDPYDPAWEAALNARAKSMMAPVLGKRWFGGWFADNELTHRDLHRYVYSRHASEAFRQFLAARYETVDALNTAWGSKYESFDDVIARKPDPILRSGAMYEAFYEFSLELVKRYVETVVRVIRAHDPDHLVFSNRFMRSGVSDWIDRLDLYSPFDAIAVNMYPANLQAGLSGTEEELLRVVHQRTGKPILLTEWSVPALDSGLYDNPAKLDWSYDQTVDTQTERARQAARVTTDLYNLPFVIGSHWFIWRDFDSAERQANRGLFRANDEPWVELQDALAGAHSRINAVRPQP
jgi:hypothetical protein